MFLNRWEMRMRDFIYCRVSTTEQTTENQLLELSRQGITAEPQRVFEEVVSGSVPMANRPKFATMLDRLERGDRVTVLKLDRLGRDVIDVMSTIRKMEEMGISIRTMDMGGVDLTSSAGKLQLGVLSVVAEFERNRIIERTREGLARAAKEGRVGGRPKAEYDHKLFLDLVGKGYGAHRIAKELGVSISKAARILKGHKEDLAKNAEDK
ncbi:recombinase family protein [Salmonella enterica]|nr:recombinase family protein [Salmonella enterica]EAP4011176.1 recombinase family protein [Salmonella enterica]EAR3906081.1 recombinase family protein [Salmonella enterica]EAR4675124.1 recombinase family protein [Salmonella enterica]EAT1928407.1 recombinase family protein [Salmonella enterica]